MVEARSVNVKKTTTFSPSKLGDAQKVQVRSDFSFNNDNF